MEDKQNVETSLNWNEAIMSGNYVNLISDEQKIIVLTNWKLEKKDKFGELQYEFNSKVLEEDGRVCDKLFTTTSNRLKRKLKEVLEKRNNTEKVKLCIIKIGDQFNTQYSVKILV